MLHEGGLSIDSIRNYLITVISASAICAIISRLTENKGSTSAVIKVLSGLFLTISVLSPVIKISFDPLADYLDSIQQSAEAVSADGIAQANEEKEVIIKGNLETYIVDKAASLGLSINASIELNSEWIPVSVDLYGNASPYARKKLESYIADTIGIPKEAQKWS